MSALANDHSIAAAAAAGTNTCIIEWLPQDARCEVLDFVGSADWLRCVPSASRGLRDLCARKEMRDAMKRMRKGAMELFKRGIDLLRGANGVGPVRYVGLCAQALVMRAAAAGLRPAMARCFYRGWGTSRDYVKAAALWQAELDDSASETEASGGACCWSAYRLAVCYECGLGVEVDEARALELYTYAAKTDENGSAMWKLYHVYRCGLLGQAADHARAVSWLRKSADSGHYEACYRACYRLGGHLERGELGVGVDLKEALRYYEKAQKQMPGWYDGNFFLDIARVRAAIAAQAKANSNDEEQD